MQHESHRFYPNEVTIAVVTPPYKEQKIPSLQVESFLAIFAPLAKEIFAITGDLPQTLSKKVKVVRMKYDVETSSTLCLIIKLLLTQLRMSYHLLKVSKNCDVVVFLHGTEFYQLPLALAKMLRKKSLKIVGGGDVREAALSKRLGGLVKIAFPPIYRLLERINYTLCDGIIAYSDSAIPSLGLDNYKHKVFTTGARFVDTESFAKQRELGERENVVGYIGRLELAKGVINLVKAMPSVVDNNPGVRFLVAGTGTLFDQIKDELECKRLTSYVTLAGWIPHQRLPDFLNEVKLLVVPSYSEGLPLVVLEAMACGTPVLATPVGNVSDVVKDGVTGFIMEDNSPECIADNIQRVLNCPDLREVVQHARGLVHREFTHEAAVQRYREILGSLLRKD